MEIDFWEDVSGMGKCPVADFIETLPIKTQAKLTKKFESFEKYSLQAMFSSKLILPLKGYDLYEIQLRIESVAYRFLCDVFGEVCLLYHAFKKKRGDTPGKEIEIALSRKKLHLDVTDRK